MKKIYIYVVLITLTFAAINATAGQEINPPNKVQLMPDLQIKQIKVAWFKIEGRGAVLEVTPIIQKNKNDKITTKPGEPMIILVSTMDKGAILGPSCKIEVTSWTREETEKSFGSCVMKPNSSQFIIKYVTVIVDSGNRVKEIKENNNYVSIEIPPQP